jgi:hypothetical protein
LGDASCRIRSLNYLLILVPLPHPALCSKVKQPPCWDPVSAGGYRHQPNVPKEPTYIFITTKKLSIKVFNGCFVNQGDSIILPRLRVIVPGATVPLLAPLKQLIDEKVGGFPTEFTFSIRRDKAQPFRNPTCGLDLTALFFHVLFDRRKFTIILLALPQTRKQQGVS